MKNTLATNLTGPHLLLRTLRYYLAANLAVIAGIAVAAAVLTGALMVGDSVRQSLRDMALQRLGTVDDALISPRFVTQSLSERMAANEAYRQHFGRCVGALTVRGGAACEEARSHTASVTMLAMADGDWYPLRKGQAIINSELAQALHWPGGDLLLLLPNILTAPADATLARRSHADTVASMHVSAGRAMVPPTIYATFSLTGGQRLPKNAWLNLDDLQDAIGMRGRLNVLLVEEQHTPGQTHPQAIDELNAILAGALTLADYGLSIDLAGDADHRVINSQSTYIPPPVDRAASAAATQLKIPLQRVSAYLANTISVSRPDGSPAGTLHYAIMAGISDVDGQAIAPGEVVLNQWTADQLHAAAGDTLQLRYYRRGNNGDLSETDSAIPLHVQRIIPTAGMGADSTLTPNYPGLTDSDSVSDWHPPEGITIDRSLVTKADEAYWKEHKAAPKLFLNLDDAHRLWGGGAFGEITSLRMPAGQADEFTKAMLAGVAPAEMGLSFQPVKAQQVAAALHGGANDFSMIFLSFSFFLIVAAVLLVAMLFRLAVEQRAKQLGLLAAIGFTLRAIHRLLLAEGIILAVIGSACGIVLSIGYTALMMAGLRTWWFDAVGTTQLFLHVDLSTLAIGFGSSLIVAVLAVVWGAWRVGRTAAARLLAGAWGNELTPSVPFSWYSGAALGWGRNSERPTAAPTLTLPRSTRGGNVVVLNILTWLIGIALVAAGMARLLSPQMAFMSGGGVLLVACLLELSLRLHPRRAANSASSLHSLVQLAFRNAGRNRSRSIMVIALIAFATFTLVTIAAMRSSAAPDVRDPKSGAGGYDLMITTDLPLYGDPATKAGRDVLGFTTNDPATWDKVQFISMRSSGGQDVSCLNLTRPNQPTLLSVPQRMIDENHFTFAQPANLPANPWTLLNSKGSGVFSKTPDPLDSAIPIIADDDTAQYILHLDVGQTMPITDEAGHTRQLLLVATLSSSIFQGQLLVSSDNFTQLFPSQSGTHVVLVRTPPGQQDRLRRDLSEELADYSASVDPTAAVLASYQRVANTYMATFQTLGSLGLLLGTVGLAVVLLRSLIERRGELAMLAALGFSRSSRTKLVLVENIALLALGMLTGCVCAIVAVLPALMSSAHQIQLAELGAALAGIFLTGVVVLVLAQDVASSHQIARDLHFD